MAAPPPSMTAAPPSDASLEPSIQQFITRLRGEPAAPPPAPRRPLATAQLLTLQGQAATLKDAVPAPGLDGRELALLQARRTPLLMEFLHLLGEGLKGAPAFSAHIGVSPALCARVVTQDGEIGKVIKAAGDCYEIASAAAAERAGQALELGEAALSAAQSFASDAARPPEARGDVELSFAEAFRLHDEVDVRAAAAGRRADRRLSPLREARDSARAEADELRLVDRYLSKRPTDE